MIASQQTVIEPPNEGSLWLVTFADLTAILVAFFVLIYAMSSPLSGQGQSSVAGGAGTAAVDRSNTQTDGRQISSGSQATLTVDYLSAVFSDRGLAPHGTDGPLSQRVEQGRLVIRLAPDFAFSEDGRTLRPLANGVVGDLSRVLSGVANPVSIMSAVPAGDWTLAFDRADSVVEALREAGYTRSVERFVAPGLPENALLVIVSDRQGGAS